MVSAFLNTPWTPSPSVSEAVKTVELVDMVELVALVELQVPMVDFSFEERPPPSQVPDSPC